jgi:hypothetical protein
MTASQIPYDALDWLQIAIYFLALPIVALAGSLFGLLGRIRRGGVFWAANVGMLAGAVTCLTCGLAIGTLNQKLPTEFVDYFTSDYRWRMLAATLGATFVCALAAAVAWRFLHKPAEKQPFVFSLRQVLLLEFFALLGLGCWISLRLFVLEASDPRVLAERQLERLKARLEAKGWVVEPGKASLSIDLTNMTPEEIKSAMSLLGSGEVGQLPRLESLGIVANDDSQFNLGPLLERLNPKGLGLNVKEPSEKTIKQLGKSNVQSLGLTGNLGSVDLGALAENASLSSIQLSGEITRKSFSTLSKSTSVKRLTLWQLKLDEGDPQAEQKANIDWPPQLEYLQFAGTFTHRDFQSLANHPKLNTLYAHWFRLNDDDIETLVKLPDLKKADIWTGTLSDRGYERLATLRLHENASGYLQLQVDSPPFDEAVVQKLKPLRGIKSLRLYWADVGDEVMDEFAEMKDLEMLHFMSPQITQEGIMKLATLPNLHSMFYPVHLNDGKFPKAFAAKRVELDLPPVDLTPIGQQPVPEYTEPAE